MLGKKFDSVWFQKIDDCIEPVMANMVCLEHHSNLMGIGCFIIMTVETEAIHCAPMRYIIRVKEFLLSVKL
jgi:hypothetical protein